MSTGCPWNWNPIALFITVQLDDNISNIWKKWQRWSSWPPKTWQNASGEHLGRRVITVEVSLDRVAEVLLQISSLTLPKNRTRQFVLVIEVYYEELTATTNRLKTHCRA